MNDQQRKIKDSQRQEKRGASLHGGRVRPASGAFATAKGDVRTDDSLIEYKRTNGNRITLVHAVLEKIRTEALSEGRRPLLGFEVGGRDYIVVSASDYQSDQEELADARENAAERRRAGLGEGEVPRPGDRR